MARGACFLHRSDVIKFLYEAPAQSIKINYKAETTLSFLLKMICILFISILEGVFLFYIWNCLGRE
jgi:hypothetical protein